jgi:hypothetical protein
MPSYACPNHGCQKRDPVTAETAPTCYTCGEAMTAAFMAPLVAFGTIEFGIAPPAGTEVCACAYAPGPACTLPDCARKATERDRAAPPEKFERETPIRPLYISLHDRVPGERNPRPCAELTYPGYRRQRVDRRRDGQWPEQITLDFPQGTATCWARFFGVSHSADGPVLWLHEIHPHIYIDAASSTTPILTLSNIDEIVTPES